MTKQKKFRTLRSTKKLEFSYDGEFYTLEIRKEGSVEYTFIWKLQEKIYGPFIGDQTEEGTKIFNMIQKKLDKGKIKF